MHFSLRLCFWLAMMWLFQSCNSSPLPESAKNQSDPTAAMTKEMAAIGSMISNLEEKLHAGEEEDHDEHGNATPQEIEILKTLQVLNQRLMQLERMIATGNQTSGNLPASRDVIEKQVIDEARKALSDHALGGQSFFTSPSLIKTNFIETENLWQVSITFKKNKASSEIFDASISCSQTDLITCNVLKIAPK
jgi:hypothetical protein